MSKETLITLEAPIPVKRGGVTLPFDTDLYLALAVIPEGKDIDLRWLLSSRPKSVVQQLLQYNLIELRGSTVHVTELGVLYKETTGNLIKMEKSGIQTQVHLQKKRVNPDLGLLREELFTKARKYNRVGIQEWRAMGIRQQWEAINRFLCDPNTDRDRYYTILTPNTKRLLREWGLLK